MMAGCQVSFSDSSSRIFLAELDRHFEPLDASLGSKEENKVELQEGVWDSVPEEILWNILMRLPVVTQCRFRCVCLKWKALLSAPPAGQHLSPVQSRQSCTVIWGGIYHEDCFFCHGENKWFRFPFQPNWGTGLHWIFVATDGGLVCYQSAAMVRPWLLICNPITGSFRVLLYDCFEYEIEVFRLASFVVDLRTKTFKVVLMGINSAVIFDSKTQQWKAFQSNRRAFPDMPSPNWEEDGFLWKNLICERAGMSRSYFVFDMDSEQWSVMEMDLPCNIEKQYHIRSQKDQVILLQVDATEEDPVQVWKLLDNAADHPNLSASKWEKIPVKIPASLKPFIHEFDTFLSHGNEYIYFSTGCSHHWIKYSFGTRTWRMMPGLGKGNRTFGYVLEEFDWFDWEPQMDMEVEPGDFKEKESLMLAALEEDPKNADLRDYLDDEYYLSDDGFFGNVHSETGSDNSDDPEGSEDSDAAFDDGI